MNLDRALARAKRIEDALRERAFLPVPEEINGVMVKQFTLRHLTILFQIRSPFLYGGIRQDEDVCVFMWVVSPHYNTEWRVVSLPWYRRWWMKLRRQPIPTLRKAYIYELVQHPRWDLFRRAIDRYLERAFMDMPPACSDGKPVSASYAAGLIHRLLPEDKSNDEALMDKPIARLFQYLNWVTVTNNPRQPQFHPLQDRIKQRALN
jgi:hypothetical protein